MYLSKCFNDVVVGQLVEWSLPTPEIRGSNPDIGNFYFPFPAIFKCFSAANMRVTTLNFISKTLETEGTCVDN